MLLPPLENDFKTAALCYVCLMNRNHLPVLIFFIIIDTVPTGRQVYIVVIPGGLGPDWGVK